MLNISIRCYQRWLQQLNMNSRFFWIMSKYEMQSKITFTGGRFVPQLIAACADVFSANINAVMKLFNTFGDNNRLSLTSVQR